jgi:hypothetical protein
MSAVGATRMWAELWSKKNPEKVRNGFKGLKRIMADTPSASFKATIRCFSGLPHLVGKPSLGVASRSFTLCPVTISYI